MRGQVIGMVSIVVSGELKEPQLTGDPTVGNRHVDKKLEFDTVVARLVRIVSNVEVEAFIKVETEPQLQFPTEQKHHFACRFQAEAGNSDIETDACALIQSLTQ